MDEDDIELALTATQEYVKQQATQNKKANVVSLVEGLA